VIQKIKRVAYGVSTAALRWHYRQIWGMKIGEGVRISRKARLDGTNPKGVTIGDYTAIAPGAVIFAHDFPNGKHLDTLIGRNCFIGGNAIILAGVTIGDNCIVAAGSVVFTDVPACTLVSGNPARTVKSGITTGKWGIQNPAFLAQQGVTPTPRPTLSNKSITRAREADYDSADPLDSYIPGLSDMSKSFDDLSIDSFALITLRCEIEENEGAVIRDEDWSQIERPSDLRRFITRPKARRSGEVIGATARRAWDINMPQMALGGLSESWLFKEVGDLHWSLLTNALGVRSRDIADQNGARLYATFTRVRYRATAMLALVEENDRLEATAAMTRFGGGMYFSSQQYLGSNMNIEVEVMSSFSKFGEHGSNTSLVKGQPEIPEGFVIPSLHVLPAIGTEYNRLRAADPSQSIWNCEYEILPQYDINGVGLLYFAAYPTVADLCLMKYLGQGAALKWSPVARDVCYFANTSADDTLIYRLYEDEGEHPLRRFVGRLFRSSDGRCMARVDVTMQSR
jgi:probable biosynthetic protein (TIGR04098 family)